MWGGIYGRFYGVVVKFIHLVSVYPLSGLAKKDGVSDLFYLGLLGPFLTKKKNVTIREILSMTKYHDSWHSIANENS